MNGFRRQRVPRGGERGEMKRTGEYVFFRENDKGKRVVFLHLDVT